MGPPETCETCATCAQVFRGMSAQSGFARLTLGYFSELPSPIAAFKLIVSQRYGLPRPWQTQPKNAPATPCAPLPEARAAGLLAESPSLPFFEIKPRQPARNAPGSPGHSTARLQSVTK